MALAGDAVVAIWNDITPEGRANFYEWHNREHMPERLAIVGFLRGRRYIALEGTPEYFTLYEVANPEVLAGEAYLAKLNSPTPWTTESVRDFRNTARSLCRKDISKGVASGGFLGTIRFNCDPVQDSALLAEFQVSFTDLLQLQAIVAAHVSRADLAASLAKTAEQIGRPANAVPRWVVLVEGSTPEAIRVALTKLSTVVAQDAVVGTYALQFDLIANHA
jgi:hypothetical protein